MKVFTIAGLLIALSACSSSGPRGGALGDPIRKVEGFTSKTIEQGVFAEAMYDPDHPITFNYDLLKKRNIVPVHLRVEPVPDKATGDGPIMLIPESMNLRLFLQDGTALKHVPASEVSEMVGSEPAREVRSREFRGGLLSEPKSGYVFFALAPKSEYRVSGGRVDHTLNGVVRTLDISGSLLSFNLTVDSESRPFYVGTTR